MKVRKAVLSDAKRIAKVHVDSWITTYSGIVPEEYLKNLTYEQRERLWENNIPNGDVFVAENRVQDIVGFSTGGEERTGKFSGYSGELYAIYILKEYQRNGLGKLLLKPVLENLQQKNISTMIVKVLEDNESCLFYEALWGKKIATVEEQISGNKFNESVYGWDDINGLYIRIKKAYW